jgi:hypothetical protein
VQHPSNLVDRHPLIRKLFGAHGFANAGITASGVIRAKTVEQILVALMLLAATVAVELSQKLGMRARDFVGGAGIALKQLWVESKILRRRSHVRLEPGSIKTGACDQDRERTGGKNPALPVVYSLSHRRS